MGEAELEVCATQMPERYAELRDRLGVEVLRQAERAITLHHIDQCWADHLAFIAPTDVATDFTTDDGVGVHVPVGAFDQPTLVRVARLGVPDKAGDGRQSTVDRSDRGLGHNCRLSSVACRLDSFIPQRR